MGNICVSVFAGGTMLTVNGYGFTKSAAVNVDGVLCQPSTTPTTTSQITCYTPQSVSFVCLFYSLF